MEISKRHLPNKTLKQKLIIQAVDDYFGNDCLLKDKGLKKNICLWLMNKRKGIKLLEEQKEAIWHIRENLADNTQLKSLQGD